ncbi:hypothetical protein F5884DRAFT_343156 [Xylogone sp. PMI_703]|nr:hypothetical protein F5884DRAFT_343156 [Xylogone sp. PMI_703]
MSFQKYKVFAQFYYYITLFSVRQKFQAFYALIHRKTYRLVPNPRRVLILGGSFAGTHLARRLAHTLPSGYTVALLEKNSHFHFAFAFPRFSVVGGHESRAFIPYDGLASDAPGGIFQHIQGVAKRVNFKEKSVDLADGRSIPYEYLVVATGAAQPPPTRLRSTSREGAIEELQTFQQQIESARNIAVVGGGAAGIELLTDIKDTYPNKEVTLIHSRSQLLPRFGPKLHEYVFQELKKYGISILLNERPKIPSAGTNGESQNVLTLSDGSKKVFDLILSCTGLRPNSGFFLPGAPECLASTGEILVSENLQIESRGTNSVFDDGHYFAIGDVAQTGGPKQARASMFQAETVVRNILKLIRGSSALNTYAPLPLEGAIKLTLGRVNEVMYLQYPTFEFLQPTKQHGEDVGAGEMWKRLNVKEDKLKEHDKEL